MNLDTPISKSTGYNATMVTIRVSLITVMNYVTMVSKPNKRGWKGVESIQKNKCFIKNNRFLEQYGSFSVIFDDMYYRGDYLHPKKLSLEWLVAM